MTTSTVVPDREIIELNTKVDDKRVELDHAEQAIERSAKRAFEEWGAQLKHIKDNRLYLAYSPSCTWEQYVQDRWEMNRRRAEQLIDAYTTLKEMEQLFPKEEQNFVLPSRESHMRALAVLPETSQKADVWRRAWENNNGGITAEIIKAEVSRYQAELEKNWYLLNQWEGLPADEQSHLLRQPPNTGKVFNLQDSDSIEWARSSWNPVTGCRHDCNYCYARDIANDFSLKVLSRLSFLNAYMRRPIPSRRICLVLMIQLIG